MASLDKTSVREEVAKLKADFEQLSRDGKVTPETGALFKSLLLVVELMMSIFMERQTRKTSKNSSLPPSQTDQDETGLAPSRPAAKRRLEGQTVANHRRVDGRNHWIHVHAAGGITLKCLHRSRGKAAIEDINIIPRYGGALIHDCWASYFAYDDCAHGLCGSPLLRELTFVVDAHGHAWARNMKRLLKDTALAISQTPDKCLDDKEQAKLQKRYRAVLTRGEKELPPVPPRPTGKRGKLAKSEAHNLWERLKRHEAAVLLFARDPHVAFTNNRAERDLRMAKVKQKVSGCFRTVHYAEAYCRISSYLQTMANQGYNPLIAIQMALAGEWAPLSGGE